MYKNLSKFTRKHGDTIRNRIHPNRLNPEKILELKDYQIKNSGKIRKNKRTLKIYDAWNLPERFQKNK